MSNKLQELTDKIFQEGVAKGNEEAEKIIESAKQEAAEIVNKAKKEAEGITTAADKSARETKKTTEAEIKLSVNQSISALRQEITNLISSKIINDEISKSLADDKFVQEIIETTIKNWSKNDQGNLDLALLVSEDQEKKVIKHFSSKAKDLLDSGLKIKAGKNIKAGFQVSPTDGSYKISFTDEDFKNFFKEYLRPKMVELLFDKK